MWHQKIGFRTRPIRETDALLQHMRGRALSIEWVDRRNLAVENDSILLESGFELSDGLLAKEPRRCPTGVWGGGAGGGGGGVRGGGQGDSAKHGKTKGRPKGLVTWERGTYPHAKRSQQLGWVVTGSSLPWKTRGETPSTQ